MILITQVLFLHVSSLSDLCRELIMKQYIILGIVRYFQILQIQSLCLRWKYEGSCNWGVWISGRKAVPCIVEPRLLRSGIGPSDQWPLISSSWSFRSWARLWRCHRLPVAPRCFLRLPYRIPRSRTSRALDSWSIQIHLSKHLQFFNLLGFF